MAMKDTLRNVAKEALLFGAVGFALATVAPALAVGFGFASTTAEAVTALHIAAPAWLGTFFGAFGAITAALTPVVKGLFGEEEKENKLKDVRVNFVVSSMQPLLHPVHPHSLTVNNNDIDIQQDVAMLALHTGQRKEVGVDNSTNHNHATAVTTGPVAIDAKMKAVDGVDASTNVKHEVTTGPVQIDSAKHVEGVDASTHAHSHHKETHKHKTENHIENLAVAVEDKSKTVVADTINKSEVNAGAINTEIKTSDTKTIAENAQITNGDHSKNVAADTLKTEHKTETKNESKIVNIDAPSTHLVADTVTKTENNAKVDTMVVAPTKTENTVVAVDAPTKTENHTKIDHMVSAPTQNVSADTIKTESNNPVVNIDSKTLKEGAKFVANLEDARAKQTVSMPLGQSVH